MRGFSGDWALTQYAPGEFVFIPDPALGFRYERPNGGHVHIRESFITDGASVPRCFRLTRWLDPYGVIMMAAFIHDYLWVLRYSGRASIGFAESNTILREAAVDCGVKRWQSWLIWFAVTVGGWYWWYRGTKQAKATEIARDLMIARNVVGRL